MATSSLIYKNSNTMYSEVKIDEFICAWMARSKLEEIMEIFKEEYFLTILQNT